jgi:hypothetical protein
VRLCAAGRVFLRLGPCWSLFWLRCRDVLSGLPGFDNGSGDKKFVNIQGDSQAVFSL